VSTSFVDEYLVRLGSSVDASGMARFHQALREATLVTEVSAAAIAGAMLKAQTEIVGGFVAIGSAALGLADKVAMADQSYRLFALHMYMSKDAARSLKVAMDALGEPLENLTWDKELRERTHQLLEDQRAMAPQGDFDSQMKKIRDIRFEMTRMEVEGQYLAMHVVNDFMTALGFGPDELLHKLQRFNDWVTHNLPDISARIVRDFLPIWHDVETVLKSAWQTAVDFAQVFTNVMSILSGDETLSGVVTLEKFAKSVEKITHWLALMSEFLSAIAGTLSGVLVGGTVGGLIGSVAGGIAGLPAGPAGVLAGAAAGGATGTAIGGGVLGAGGAVIDLYRHLHPGGTGAVVGALPGSDAHALVAAYAARLGVDPLLASSLATAESGFNQGAVSAAGATGIMQLTRSTARGLGVDRDDPEGNVRGGLSLLSTLLKHYNGDVPTAVAAYHEGQPKMDAILAGKATLSSEAYGEVAAVMRGMGKTGDVHIGSIVVHVDKSNATNADVGRAVAAEIRAKQDKGIQRNISEFQSTAWSY
jgi:hypothetical protein